MVPARGMSIRAYAQHRRLAGLPGGSKRAVEMALRSGRIPRNQHGKIDPAEADLAWLANSPGSRPISRPDAAVGLCRLAAAIDRLAAAIEGRPRPKFQGSAFEIGLRGPIGG